MNSNNIVNTVILDLGSESMYAFLGKEQIDQCKEINLQDKRNIKKWAGLDENECKFYKVNEVISVRIKNKFAINRQALSIKDFEKDGDCYDIKKEHANVDFNSNYRQSIFDIYQSNNNYDVDYLCNPKVIYTKGITSILPTYKVKENNIDEISINANCYLKHLTVQVVNNLILKSPEMRKEAPEKSNLIITVPNVYSLTHASELIDFVKAHTRFNNVDYVYESDAVVYASLFGQYDSMDDSGKDETINQLKHLAEKVNEINDEIRYIITQDIGKGTTDLSLCAISASKNQAGLRPITNIARIGNTKGGNCLDYIFVEYFNKLFLEFCKKENIENKFDILHKNESYRQQQNEINEYLQNAIFHIKCNITENYTFPKRLFEELKANQDEENNLVSWFDKFCSTLINEAFDEPKEDTKEDFKSYLTQNLFDLNSLTGRIRCMLSSNIEFAKELLNSIKDYTKELGDLLPRLLKKNADTRTMIFEGTEFKVNGKNTFLVVSGQASQFKPLNKIIRKTYDNKIFGNINIYNMFFLENETAKKVCSIGAFAKSEREGIVIENSDELLSNYYLENMGGDEKTNLIYDRLNKGDKINCNTIERVNLKYNSILDAESLNDREILNRIIFDDFGAYIMTYPRYIKSNSEPIDIAIKYDKANHYLEINNEKVELSSTGKDKNIHKNVWPELLKANK